MSIPDSLVLAEKNDPLPIKVFRKRSVTPAGSNSTANPGDTSVITFDTSTPLTFTDIDNSYFMFDIQFINTYAMVDYCSFPLDGVGGAVIQRLEIQNAGNTLELIDEYGLISQQMMDIEATCDVEIPMYFSSQLKNGVIRQAHKNFIKPPMVSSDGNIMFGPNPLGLGFDSMASFDAIYNSKYQLLQMNANQGDGTTINYPAMVPLGCRGLSVVQQIQSTASTSLDKEYLYGTPSYINQRLVDSGPLLAAAATALPGALKNGPTPMDWPDFFDPSQISIVGKFVKEYGSINRPKMMANLNNVKFFPIGMIPGANPYNDGAYKTASPAYTTAVATSGTNNTKPIASNPSYRVCYRPRSGIIGREASKMFPNQLVQTQQFQVRVQWTAANIAMQLSSDPCRTITNTLRDRIRNIGQGNGKNWLDTTFTTQDISTWDGTNAANNRYMGNIYTPAATNYAPGYIPYAHGIGADTEANHNFSASVNSIFSSSAAAGYCLLNGTNGGGFSAEGNVGPVSFLPPTPQYVLTKTPWLYKNVGLASAIATKYCLETDAFYGTKDEWSSPQCRRILDFPSGGDVAGSGATAGFQTGGPLAVQNVATAKTGISYQITNFAWVSDVITVPPEVSSHILRAAEMGDYMVYTKTYTTVPISGVQNSDVQNLIIPARANACQQMVIVFQDRTQRDNNYSWFYNSFAPINPFVRISPAANDEYANISGWDASLPNSQLLKMYGVGVSKAPIYEPMFASPNASGAAYSVQLQIAQTYYPQMPLTSAEEMVVEWLKAFGEFNSKYYEPRVDSSVITKLNTAGTGSDLVYDPLENGKWGTGFVPYCLLDDQTITTNYDMAPLLSVQSGSDPKAAGNISNATSNGTTVSNGYRMICPRGYTVPCYIPPESRFKLAFNFKSFPQELMDGYLFLGTNTITLLLKGAVGLNCNALGSGNLAQYQAWAILCQNATLTYGLGGTMVFIK